MKLLFKCILFFLPFLSMAKDPIVIEIPFDKRVTLIFPSKIVENVGGSDILDIAVNENRYYITSLNASGFPETSLYIELETGHVYDFKIRFNNSINNAVRFITYEEATGNIKEQSGQPYTAPVTVAPSVVSKNPQPLKVDSSNSYRINANKVINLQPTIFGIAVIERKLIYSLESIYIIDDKLYLTIKMVNQANIAYDILSTDFNVVPKTAVLSKNVTEPEKIVPIYIFNSELKTIPGKGSVTKVFVFDKITISDKKKLMVSLWESGGDRELNLNISGNDLLKAKTLR